MKNSLSTQETHASVKNLTQFLANTYLLYVKTQNYHWNVEGPTFAQLHLFLEDQYQVLAEAVDQIAERIRKLDHPAPGTLAAFLKHATLSEETPAKNAQDMLRNLLADHTVLVTDLRKMVKAMDGSDDEGTKDFFIERLRSHEKMAWMLRSHVKG